MTSYTVWSFSPKITTSIWIKSDIRRQIKCRFFECSTLIINSQVFGNASSIYITRPMPQYYVA